MKKRHFTRYSNLLRLTFLILIFWVSVVVVRGYTDADVRTYVEKYRQAALATEHSHGIPASITLAQGILESGAGMSKMAREANNHFGVKATSTWKGDIFLAKDDEYKNGKRIYSRFRKYPSVKASFEDHAKVLCLSYYKECFKYSVYDYRNWAKYIKKGGYATAPNYVSALIGIIDKYQLYKINGGVKLKGGKGQQTIKIQKTNTQFTGEDEEVIDDDEITEEEEELIEAQEIYKFLVEINQKHCTVMMPGETLRTIALRYDIDPEDLLEFNEISSDKNLKPGDIIFLEKKDKKYKGSRDNYDPQEGESLYRVSQKFGIKLENLAKLNNMKKYVTLKQGDRIKLK